MDRAIYPGGPAHCGRRLCPHAGQDLRADDDALDPDVVCQRCLGMAIAMQMTTEVAYKTMTPDAELISDCKALVKAGNALMDPNDQVNWIGESIDWR